jgi:hypothetical protein
MALAILMELNIRLTLLVVETARLEWRGINDSMLVAIQCFQNSLAYFATVIRYARKIIMKLTSVVNCINIEITAK